MHRLKKIILSGHDNSGSRYILKKLASEFPEVEFSVIITEGIYYKKSFLQSVLKLVIESSILFCAVRAFEMLVYKIKGDTIESHCRKNGIEFIKTADINGKDIVDYVNAKSPDLLVSLYTMHIYKEPLISLPKYGSINSHPSILPEYRGLEVFFWAMANGEKNTGSSVFYLSENVDDGRVIHDEVIPLEDRYTMHDVYDLITERGAELIVQSIRDIDNDAVQTRTPVGEGSYFPMPTRGAVWNFIKQGKRFF